MSCATWRSGKASESATLVVVSPWRSGKAWDEYPKQESMSWRSGKACKDSGCWQWYVPNGKSCRDAVAKRGGRMSQTGKYRGAVSKSQPKKKNNTVCFAESKGEKHKTATASRGTASQRMAAPRGGIKGKYRALVGARFGPHPPYSPSGSQGSPRWAGRGSKPAPTRASDAVTNSAMGH